MSVDWRASLLGLVLLFAAAGAAAQGPNPGDNELKPGERVALVIGNSRYQHIGELANPKNDAALLAETLKGLHFKLVGGGPQIDLDRHAFETAIRSFGRQIGGADVALFYYAGHGLQVRGTNWLVPVSADPTGVADLDYEMIDSNLVVRQMQEARTHLNIIILDACRNNPFGAVGLRSATGGLAQMVAPEGTLISYATQPGAVARDGEDADSPFSKALAATIRKPGFDIFQVFNAVGLEVKRETGGEQQPWVSSSPIDGDFYFAAVPPGPAATPAPAPAVQGFDPRQVELAFWESVKDSKDPADYRDYLDRYPDGAFAELARTRIAALTRTEPAPQPQAAPDRAATIGPDAKAEAARKDAEREAAEKKRRQQEAATAAALKKDAGPAKAFTQPADPRCAAIVENTQLGESLSNDDRTYLVQHCR